VANVGDALEPVGVEAEILRALGHATIVDERGR
jgi:hypothetical protein